MDQGTQQGGGADLIEVRTPTHQRPVLLRRALKSLVAQTYSHWRCVVLDDESGNGDARAVVSEFDDSRILFQPNERNLGVGANIDRAFSIEPLPGSTHACVLEDDNYYLPDFMRSNLADINESEVDIVLRNQLIETPAGRDLDGQVGPRTAFDGQYSNGTVTQDELWSTFFYSTGANNSSLFWRLGSGLCFSTLALTADPVFQERLRTLCIDRDVLVAMDPLVVWRDNRDESMRPKSTGVRFVISQVRAAARERQLYQVLFDVLRCKGNEINIWNPRFRTFDSNCERVFVRCGLPTPTHSNLTRYDRTIIGAKRNLAAIFGAFLAEPIKYRLGEHRIEARAG